MHGLFSAASFAYILETEFNQNIIDTDINHTKIRLSQYLKCVGHFKTLNLLNYTIR